MRKKTIEEMDEEERCNLSGLLSSKLSRVLSSKLSPRFSWQGKLVLISIGFLISAGWVLVSVEIWWLALVVLVLLGSVATVSFLSVRE